MRATFSSPMDASIGFINLLLSFNILGLASVATYLVEDLVEVSS